MTCADELWCWPVVQEIDEFMKKLDDKIEKEQQQLKARRKKNELESKMAQELKLNAELTQQLAEITRRGLELDKVCANLPATPTIADSDQARLDNAKETYEIAKELTGIRFDYTAPPGVAVGYVKSAARRLLQPFEEQEADALWARVRAAAAPRWPRAIAIAEDDAENKPTNKIL